MAALFASARSYATGKVYNLQGGILAWQGKTLPDFPKVEIFPLDGDPAQILYRAMDLERGAYHFYREVLKRHPRGEFAHFMDMLLKAEEGHARIVYGYYKRLRPECQPFEALYSSLPGDVLEGGQSLDTIRHMLDTPGPDPCVDIVELAIDIEYTAYDLYRVMAERYRNEKEMHGALLAIAQAEKEHMRLAAEALSVCDESA